MRRTLAIFSLLAAGLGLWLVWTHPPVSLAPPQRVVIATMPLSFTGYTIFLAQEKGFFQEQGLQATLVSHPRGEEILQALVRGEADFGVSSETPFMHAVMNGAPLSVLAATITARNHLGLVARRDLGIASPADLQHAAIGVTQGSNGEFFLDQLLALEKIPRQAVTRVFLKPDQMVAALLAGEVAAVATWNPPLQAAVKQLGERAILFDAQGIYSPLFLLSARDDVVSSRRETGVRLLRALVAASRFIRDNRDLAHDLVAPYLGIDAAILKESSASYLFEPTLEQTLLVTLENQAHWAIANGLTDRREIPDFFARIRPEILAEVSPASVTLFR